MKIIRENGAAHIIVDSKSYFAYDAKSIILLQGNKSKFNKSKSKHNLHK